MTTKETLLAEFMKWQPAETDDSYALKYYKQAFLAGAKAGLEMASEICLHSTSNSNDTYNIGNTIRQMAEEMA